ncbi:MAG: Gfo/Idh/MocA family oxidoreductase [Verrucomicrobiales bacterium]|nr:Gfo/Idh/MocA family oxidoreductase [Verrucomicrobiales bacterium]
MNPTSAHSSPSSRRQFLKAGAATAFAGMTVPFVHAAEDNTLNVALIGCGGRGSGAAKNALDTKLVPTKLVAMADVFEHRLNGSYAGLSSEFAAKPGKVDVPQERKFVGFDAYRRAIDCLKPGDIAIFATPLAFRWLHFKHAVEKGVHVFMEKPLTADVPTSKRMLQINEEAKKKGLKVGVGLMIRHCRVRQALFKRIKDGEIGDIISMRAYRMHPPVVTAFSHANKVMYPPNGKQELMYQIERFHSFLWASGGLFSDFNIHQIDECCWMKDAWPVKVHAIGGRHYRKDPQGKAFVDQNFDVYACEYTFADGAKLHWNSRIMNDCKQDFHSYAHGSKGSAIISLSGHSPGHCATFRGQQIKKDDRIWEWPEEEEPNPYQTEWDDLVESIVKGTEHNEVERGVMASLVTSMGRHAAHTGQEIKLDDFMKLTHEFAPDVEKFTPDGPAPVTPDADGNYPWPAPGIKKDREY